MLMISHEDWTGTKEELQARISAFAAAREAHKFTEGVPAPREIELVEKIFVSGADFEILKPPLPAPLPEPPPPETQPLPQPFIPQPTLKGLIAVLMAKGVIDDDDVASMMPKNPDKPNVFT